MNGTVAKAHFLGQSTLVKPVQAYYVLPTRHLFCNCAITNKMDKMKLSITTEDSVKQ